LALLPLQKNDDIPSAVALTQIVFRLFASIPTTSVNLSIQCDRRKLLMRTLSTRLCLQHLTVTLADVADCLDNFTHYAFNGHRKFSHENCEMTQCIAQFLGETATCFEHFTHNILFCKDHRAPQFRFQLSDKSFLPFLLLSVKVCSGS